MATTRRAGWAAGLLASLSLVAGCSGEPPTGEVTGTVTVDGKVPADGSSITLFPTDGKSPSAGDVLDKDGKYRVKVAVGTARVEIRVPRPVGKPKAVKAGPGAEGYFVEESLPAKYNDESELQLDVHSGNNPKDYELKSK
jgi:hypothetical protein